MSTVIKVENLGKKYTLRHQQRKEYTALRDGLIECVHYRSNRQAVRLEIEGLLNVTM